MEDLSDLSWAMGAWADERWVITDETGTPDVSMIIPRPAGSNPPENNNPFTPWGRTFNHVHMEPTKVNGELTFVIQGLHVRASFQGVQDLLARARREAPELARLALLEDPEGLQEFVQIRL